MNEIFYRMGISTAGPVVPHSLLGVAHSYSQQAYFTLGGFMSNQEPEPQFEFQGTFCTAEIFYMVEDSVITRNEAWLLLTIDSLCNRKTGEDCFASNEWLANRCGITARNVQKALVNLKELGLVEQTKFDGRKRWMKTHIRTYSRDVVADIPNMSATTSIKGSKDPKKIKRTQGVAATRTPPGGLLGDSLGLVDEEGTPKTHQPSLPIQWSKEFKEGLRACRPSALIGNNWSDNKQAEHFRLLMEKDEVLPSRIDVVLQWFIDHNMGKGGQDGLPSHCKSPALFRKCFSWISDKYDEQLKSTTSPIPKNELLRFEEHLATEKMEELAEYIEDELELD